MAEINPYESPQAESRSPPKAELTPAMRILQKKKRPSWAYSALALQVLFAGVGWVLAFASFLPGGMGILFLAASALLQGFLISMLITLAVRERIYWLLILQLVVIFLLPLPLLLTPSS